jgi:phosphate transport system protein
MPRETFQQELDGLVSDVAAFGDEVEGSLKNTVVAMEARDVCLARQELGVDLLYSEAMNLIANPSEGGGGAPEWRMRAALMVHYLERISDHGVGLGESTVFLVTGERIEDAMQPYTDRELGEE